MASDDPLARSEQNLRTLIEHAQVGLLVHRFGPIAYANPALVAMLGYADVEALQGRDYASVFHGNDLAGRFAHADAPDRGPITARLAHANGQVTWTEVRGVAIEYDGAPAMLLQLRDLTGERRTRAVLREREGRIWSLFAESPISLWEGDFVAARIHLQAQGATRDALAAQPTLVDEALRRIRFIAINEATLRLLEAPTPEALLQRLGDVFTPARGMWADLFTAMLEGATRFEGACEARTLLGDRRHLGVRLHALPGHEEHWGRVVLSIVDLTAHVDNEALIRAALREKEVMLREINHRIKNNLQVISSLLSLQSQHVADPTTRAAFADSQGRVHAIALVHDQLYHAKDLASVDVAGYMRQLLGGMLRVHDGRARGITGTVTGDGVVLPVDLAIPLGLLVNELVGNALRHAFPDRGGTVRIDVARQGGRVVLGVADDGIGLPEGLVIEQTPTLGLGLVMTFVEQLEATLEVERVGGTRFVLAFAAPS